MQISWPNELIFAFLELLPLLAPPLTPTPTATATETLALKLILKSMGEAVMKNNPGLN